jgi:hypothetical protein
METYCKDISFCRNKERHIETQMLQQPFLPEHQSKVVPCRYEDIYAESESYFGKNSSEHEMLFKLIGKPVSVRYNTNQAMYLTKYMKDKDLDTISEVINHIMARVMKEDSIGVRKGTVAKK